MRDFFLFIYARQSLDHHVTFSPAPSVANMIDMLNVMYCLAAAAFKHKQRRTDGVY